MAGARLARNEGRQRTRRSLTSTLPADLAPSRAWMSDRPSWCVDLGPTLVAMTTCDLWLALARSEITPRTKVWREGMPYWDAIEKVPEFALAMPDASVWATDGAASAKAAKKDETAAAARVAQKDEAAAHAAKAATKDEAATPVMAAFTAPATSMGESTMVEVESSAFESVGFSDKAHAATPEPSAAGVITLVPPSDFITPAPVVVEPRADEPAPMKPRRLFPRLDRGGVMSVAIGAGLAILALTLATTGPVSPRPATGDLTAAARPGAGAPERSSVDFASMAVRATADREQAPPADETRFSTQAAPASSVVGEKAHARGPRAADRGQRRAR